MRSCCYAGSDLYHTMESHLNTNVMRWEGLEGGVNILSTGSLNVMSIEDLDDTDNIM